MAVPTITLIEPAQGHTGGRTVVEIQGTGFMLPLDPPAGVFPVVEPPPSVAVFFGGEPALDVAVESDTVCFAVSPICPLPMTGGQGKNDLPFPAVVTITLQNLDAQGAAVPGELATAATPFEYLRPDLSKESHGTITLACFIEELRRQVTPGVDHAVHSDYSDNGATELNLAYLPPMPALVILSMAFLDAVGRPQGAQASPMTTSGNFARRREPVVLDVEMDILGISNDPTELKNLLFATRTFFQINPELRVPRNITDPSQGIVKYTLDFAFGDPMTVTAGAQETNSNLMNFSLKCAIRGLTIEQMPGLPEQGTTDTPATLAHAGTVGVTHEDDQVEVEMERLP